MVSADVLAAADQNMVSAWRALAAIAPAPKVVDHADGVVLISTGIPLALFNPAFVTSPVADADALVAAIADHYTSLGSTYVVYSRDEVAPEVAAACERAGMVEYFRPPLMVLDPIPDQLPTEPAPGLVITEVDATTIGDAADVVGRGFGMPAEMVAQIFVPQLLDIENFTTFVGAIDGTPVTTAAVFVAHGLAGIYNVATVPEGRGKGAAAAVTWHAANAGRQAGATRSILQSSEAGQPIYRRMGYDAPAAYRQFEPAH